MRQARTATAIAGLLIAVSLVCPATAKSADAGEANIPGVVHKVEVAYMSRAALSPEAFLHEQLDHEKERQQKIGQDCADDAMRLAAEEAEKVSQQAEEDIESTKLSARGSAQQEIIASIEAESRKRQLAIRCFRQAEARQHLALAEQRARAIEQSAQTLAKEMAKPPAANGFGLSPHGSNLYVRNYTHGRTP